MIPAPKAFANMLFPFAHELRGQHGRQEYMRAHGGCYCYNGTGKLEMVLQRRCLRQIKAGFYVPAASVRLGLSDGVFTRMGGETFKFLLLIKYLILNS